MQIAAQYLTLLDNVGICLYNNKLYERAEPIVCKSIELRQAMDGIVNAEILTSMDTLAGLWLNQKGWSEAEELAAKVLEERKRLLGDEHRDTPYPADPKYPFCHLCGPEEIRRSRVSL
jgi:hypothetical protein